MTADKSYNLDNSVVSTLHSQSYADPTTNTDFYGGNSKNTDGGSGLDLTGYTCAFPKWHNYYCDVDIFAEIIDVMALWVVGKGYKADEKTKEKLRRIRGWGKDDFNTIIENLLRTALMCGDSFAQIIRDKAKRITNLKPLNSGSVKTVVNEYGIIDHYEQWINNKKVTEDFAPDEIFHLCWNRLADEIHGKPLAEREEQTIKQIKQIIDDLGLRFHRIVRPVRLFEAKTSNKEKLEEVETDLKNGYKNCEFIVVPAGTLEAKDVATIPDAKDAIEYLNLLMRKLVTSCGVPEVVMGWSVGTTDASAKIVYLSFQQPTERKQLFLEEQIKMQLGLEVEFEFPASLEPVTKNAGDIDKATGAPQNRAPSEDNKKNKKMNNL